MQPAIEEGYAILISTFSELEAAEEHRVEEDLRVVAEKRHPRKPPKDLEEADKRKALDAKKQKESREKLSLHTTISLRRILHSRVCHH